MLLVKDFYNRLSGFSENFTLQVEQIIRIFLLFFMFFYLLHLTFEFIDMLQYSHCKFSIC